MHSTIKQYLGLIFLLSLSACGDGGGGVPSVAPSNSATAYSTTATAAAAANSGQFGVFTSFTSARALSFKVSGIALANTEARNDSVMAANYEQGKIAIVSIAAWPQGEPVLTFDGKVTGEVLLSDIEQLSGNFQTLPPLIEVRSIR